LSPLGAPEAAIRWIADAVMILRKGDVDWSRVVEQTTRRRFVLRMSDALGYLRAAMTAPVPESGVSALAATPNDRFERLERRLLAREHRVLGQLPLYWCHHLRACGGDLLAAARTFPRYLQYAWISARWADFRGVLSAARSSASKTQGS
jgi:HAMP domain-containing protein